MNKKYIRLQIDTIKTRAAYRLGLHNDDMGAMALYNLIEEYVTWEQIEQQAVDVRKIAKENGLI